MLQAARMQTNAAQHPAYAGTAMVEVRVRTDWGFVSVNKCFWTLHDLLKRHLSRIVSVSNRATNDLLLCVSAQCKTLPRVHRINRLCHFSCSPSYDVLSEHRHRRIKSALSVASGRHSSVTSLNTATLQTSRKPRRSNSDWDAPLSKPILARKHWTPCSRQGVSSHGEVISIADMPS